MGTGKFGWCLDDLHEKCWTTNNDLTCTCICHKGEK